MAAEDREGSLIERMRDVGLLTDPGSPEGERIVRVREASRAIGIDETAGAELIQAYARAVARIVAAEAEMLTRTVSPAPADSYARRLADRAAVAEGLAVEMFAAMRSQQLGAAAMELAEAAPRNELKTVAFVDLCGSTRFMQECSLDELRATADELFFAAQGVANSHGLSVVKYLGDGVVLLGADPAAALEATVELLPVLAERTGLRAAAGISRGRQIAHAGDLLGPAVNLASRLAELAAPGEALVDADRWPGVAPGVRRGVVPRGLGAERMVYAVGTKSVASTYEARVGGASEDDHGVRP
jgi:adenylate cyclase